LMRYALLWEPSMSKPFLLQQRIVVQDSGTLLALELPDDFNIQVRRMFVVNSVPPMESRGDHAHRECVQILTCVDGEIEVTVDNGNDSWTFLLSPEGSSLCIPPGLWATQKYLRTTSTLVVLASHHYDEGDYFRVREEYLDWKKGSAN
jgi:UDP-2-acetamido-3-amino-2,3-dideoxy-glucuronate N-acetyltransferase